MWISFLNINLIKFLYIFQVRRNEKKNLGVGDWQFIQKKCRPSWLAD